MGSMYAYFEASFTWLKKQTAEIFLSLGQNNLWKRMIRNVVTTTLTAGVCLIHYEQYSPTFGKAAYIAAMVSIFVHPGRRVGQLVEALILALLGAFIGISWSLLGLYLSSLLMPGNPSAAYAVRGLFFAGTIMFHGFFRSHTPRVFLFVLLLVIESLSALTTTSVYVTSIQVKQQIYPVLLAASIILIVNVLVFPEFSTPFLGQTTIDALYHASATLAKSGKYFVETAELESSVASVNEEQTTTYAQHRLGGLDLFKDAERLSLVDITTTKAKLRQMLAACRNAQNECQFEVAYSHLPPHAMSPISKKAMKGFTRHVISVIGACETRFALLGDESVVRKVDKGKKKKCKSVPEGASDDGNGRGVNLELLKPHREIEFGDVRLFRHLLKRIRGPYVEFQAVLTRSVDVVVACLAFVYDVPSLPSKAIAPSGITMEELDLHHETLKSALKKFDENSTAALEGAAVMEDLSNEDLDFMPRQELFLIASFLLNVRLAATKVHDMLRVAQTLVQIRSEGTKFRRLYVPKIQWRKWLYSGGVQDESMPATEKYKERQESEQHQGISSEIRSSEIRLEANSTHIVESATSPKDSQNAGGDAGSKEDNQPPITRERSQDVDHGVFALRTRGKAADVLEWIQNSEDFSYAFKLTIATFLVAFPAFVPSLNYFYYRWRGVWAALQLIFVFDVAIGTSINNFFTRAVGTTLGSLWGWAAYEARMGNALVCTAMIFVGLIPFNYVLLGTRYPKAGTVSLISLCVVAMATELQTVPGSGTENFLNRWLAFLVGGLVALIVQVVLLPVKARTKMVDALAAAIMQIGGMEACVAYGIDNGIDLSGGFPPSVFKRFDRARTKANLALGSAEMFFPFCGKEPRLKGAWSSISSIYEEMIFILHQIVDKMDNMLQLRLSFGSGPLEEFNARIYQYRRNVAGSISLILYAVHEALITKYPLPQFVPSARLAHLRMINKIREVIQQSVEEGGLEDRSKKTLRQTMRRKYISWSASAAAQAEVIVYLEELTDLAKLLVGATEFRSGVLHRPTFQRRSEGRRPERDEKHVQDEKTEGQFSDEPPEQTVVRKSPGAAENAVVPSSLNRI